MRVARINCLSESKSQLPVTPANTLRYSVVESEEIVVVKVLDTVAAKPPGDVANLA
jgi:hypothetical protein